MPAARTNLVGRRDECALIAELLAGVRAGRGDALVLSGEAGIGKSALCDWAREQAADLRVLLARCAESERELPFAGLKALLACIADLPTAQADVLAAALAGQGGGDRFTIGAAVAGVLGRTAERRPVVAIVDDAQWLDPASADALLFAVRRLRGEAVAFVLATRTGSRFDADRPGLTRLVLRGLDRESARALLTRGQTIADVAERLARAAEGNPRALLELPALLNNEARHEPTRGAGALVLLPRALAQRAELDFTAGQWARAAAEAQEAVALAERARQPAAAAHALDCLARIAACAGEEGRCRALVADGLRLVDAHGIEPLRGRLAGTLGLLELGLGRPAAAIPHLESAAPAGADLIEAYVRAGDLDAAEEALAVLSHDAELTGRMWVLGTAARCRGLLGRGDAHFADALHRLDAIPAPFEVARTHLCRGELLRRAGRRRDARQALLHAIEGFDRLGATPWAARARLELRATGATARRRRADAERDRLTPHELRVALIVAGGASNREAAAALFLSPKTIEFHLAQIYRKLGVRRRTELALLAVRRGWLEGAAD